MIITISGTPGSGKSSVGRILADKLGLKKYSIGDLRGKMAKERGLTIDEFNKLGETEEFTDKDADDYQKKLGETEDDFIIDGRLSFYFIPNSIKIFLDVSTDVGAERIFKDPRDDEKEFANVSETRDAIMERMHSDRVRYKKYYDLDPFDKTLYDIVIDTDEMSVDDCVSEILKIIEKEFKK